MIGCDIRRSWALFSMLVSMFLLDKYIQGKWKINLYRWKKDLVFRKLHEIPDRIVELGNFWNKHPHEVHRIKRECKRFTTEHRETHTD
uniref:Uncharacterized protein n=1 Tax=Anopheles atroparvus TaxID=41427 RepID=A0AAG5DTR8_ANOAO